MNLFRPRMNTEPILKALRRVLDSGWIGMGEETFCFEGELATFLHVAPERVIATNSCSEALRIAVMSLDLPSGAKVITTPNTFVSTNHALLWNGLRPVFVDVEAGTGNIDANCVARVMEKQRDIRAIMCVHIGGYPCDMVKLNWLSELYHVPIIEDCAHALGSHYLPDQPVGSGSNIACFSFHAVKNLPMGDGGAIVAPRQLAKRMRRLRWLGIDKSTMKRTKGERYSWEYDVLDVGCKGHMNDIVAAIGREQLRVLNEQNRRRRQIGEYYREHVRAGKPEYSVNRCSSCHFVPFFFRNRDKVCAALQEAGVHFGMHYRANYKYAVYQSYRPVDGLPNMECYENTELTLPLYPGMSDTDTERVVEIVNKGAQ